MNQLSSTLKRPNGKGATWGHSSTDKVRQNLAHTSVLVKDQGSGGYTNTYADVSIFWGAVLCGVRGESNPPRFFKLVLTVDLNF